MPELIRKSQDGTREIFEPIVAQCSRASQYNVANPPERAKFSFGGFPDYWQVPRDQAHPIPGNWYTVTLSINTGANGTKYHDIMLLEPAALPADDVGADAKGLPWGTPTQDELLYDGPPTHPGLSAPESLLPRQDGPPDWDAINAAKDHTIALSAATRDAMIAIQIMAWPVPGGRTFTSWLRECRARLFYAVHDREIEPQFWCYEHGQARNQGSNGYGHPVDGGACIWEKGIIMNDIKEK